MYFNCAAALTATLLSLHSPTPVAVPAPVAPAVTSPVNEEARQSLRAEAKADGDLTKLLDNSSPAEIARDLGLEDDEDAQIDMVTAQTALINIDVSIRRQTMVVKGPDGGIIFGPWHVSTTAHGMPEQKGRFAIDAKRMYRVHFSSQYHGSPMPDSLFYKNGRAIHGTDHPEELGSQASMGCVRLHKANARRLFDVVQPIVKMYGTGSAIIHVHD